MRAARATEAARGRERAAADRKERMDAVMLRERVAQYEKLLHGLHAVAAQAVDAAAECQKRIDAAEILMEDGRPGGARPAEKLAPSQYQKSTRWNEASLARGTGAGATGLRNAARASAGRASWHVLPHHGTWPRQEMAELL